MADTIEAEFVETPDENVETEVADTNETNSEDSISLKMNLSIGESEIKVVKSGIATNMNNIQQDLQSVTDIMQRIIYNDINDDDLERVVNSNLSWIIGIGLSGFKYLNLEKTSMRDIALKMCMDIIVICNVLISNSANSNEN